MTSRQSGPSERIARAFHDKYEELAPLFGYATRDESKRPWDRIPAENRHLMIATVMDLLDEGVIRDGAE